MDTIELDEAVRAMVAAFTTAVEGNAVAITPDLLNRAAYLMGLQSGAIAQLSKYAARYRFLRDCGDAAWRPWSLRDGATGEAADARVEAAMEAAKP